MLSVKVHAHSTETVFESQLSYKLESLCFVGRFFHRQKNYPLDWAFSSEITLTPDEQEELNEIINEFLKFSPKILATRMLPNS